MFRLARVGYLVAGILLANSLPHLAIGVSGRRKSLPFKADAPAAAHLAWGVGNLSAGVLALRRADRTGDAHADPQAWLRSLLTGALGWSAFMLVFEALAAVQQGAARRP